MPGQFNSQRLSLKQSPKGYTLLHGKGGDGARHVRGSLSCTSFLAVSWLLALQDSQHVSDNEGSLTVSFIESTTRPRHERVVLQRQISTPNRPNASSVLQLHEVGSVHVPSSQDHGRRSMGGDGAEARSRRTYSTDVQPHETCGGNDVHQWPCLRHNLNAEPFRVTATCA